MSKYKKNIGNRAEEQACKYLEKNNYKIIQRNFSSKIGEIDIIAYKNDTIIFIEVKYRRSGSHGSAIEAVNYRKQKKIIKISKYFLLKNEKYYQNNIRYDVIGISNNKIDHIKGAFIE